MPDEAEAVMTDNSRQMVPVTWNQEVLEAVNTLREGEYRVIGEALGLPVRGLITVSDLNWLRNGGFEEEDVSMWRVTDLGGAAELYREVKPVDAKKGQAHWHFYSAERDTVRFTLEQEAQDLPAGCYRYEISVMGGDCGEQEVYSYVMINGEVASRCETAFTRWNEWHTAVIENIQVQEGDNVVVGLYVACSGPGAWGKIDEAYLK